MNQISIDNPTIARLSNGLRFLYIPQPHVNTVYLTLGGNVGWRAETGKELGAAHFLEHLFFDGTTRRPSAAKINALIENVGGKRNGHTNAERVWYWAKVVEDDAEVAFDYISDIFQNSLLKEFDKERKVVAQEAAFKHDNPNEALFWYQQETLFPGQPIGRTMFDQADNLSNMTYDVVSAYHKRAYVAENFVLCVCGNIDFNTAKDLAEKYFSSIKNGVKANYEKAIYRNEPTTNIQHRDIEQAKLAISFKGFARSDSMSTGSMVLSTILGTGSNSRLYNRIRNDLHLAYSLFTENILWSDSGFFTIYTYVDEGNLQKVVTEIMKELQKTLNQGIKSDELQRAKAVLLSNLYFTAEDTITMGELYMRRFLMTNEAKNLKQQADEIKAITLDQIMNVAQMMLQGQPTVTAITKDINALDVPGLH